MNTTGNRNEPLTEALDDFTEIKTLNANQHLKKADLNSISRRCGFVSSAISQTESLTNPEWDTLKVILLRTKDGNEAVSKLSIKRQETSDEKDESQGGVVISQAPSCEWINSITNEKHCGHCDMCGVIKTPVDFGFKPWNTNKRIMSLGGHLDDEILISEAVLAEYDEIFYKDERLVRVIGNRSKAVSGSKHVPLQVKSVTAANLKEMLSTKFIFLKMDEDKIRAVYPPPPLIGGLLERANYPSLRHLRGVTEVPVLRPDGTVLQEVGYDAATELLYRPRQSFPLGPFNALQNRQVSALQK